MPQYPAILDRLRRQDGKLLDLGCCFGQELRRLVYDGGPSSSLYGLDLRDDFFALGAELFRDAGTFQGRLLAGDIFTVGEGGGPEVIERAGIAGQIDVVYASSFFHLFDREQQVRLARSIAESVLRPVPGSMILGRQRGVREPGVQKHDAKRGIQSFQHDEVSWRTLWEEVGAALGIAWEIEAELVERAMPSGSAVYLVFCVTRK